MTGDVSAATRGRTPRGGTDQLGQRIREARLARGMSLRETAARAGVSPSLLSQVETGKVQPSVTTLYAVVTCLDLSVDEVLDHQPGAGPLQDSRSAHPVQRAVEAPTITMGDGVTWQGLAVMPGPDHVDGVLATYAPRAASSGREALTRHAGVEHGYVLTGELTLRLESETYVLRAGDSFCFDSMRPHLYVNHTDEEAQGIWYIVNGSKRPPSADDRVGTGLVRLDASDGAASVGRGDDRP
ncbi:cupin domain-containing protein [Actinotalea sp. Marseille-Q4924]|uniref:cupin domain-containing protein n=1 Tax=Actinotalea sp. Marseille-Q4924 TaxID=2866571 RepID=UPI001CE3EDA1|nr:cupin domain-containing protein [Actinotalea sp. Marseille-Q4924]